MLPIEALRMRSPVALAIDGTSGSTDAGILAAVYFTLSGTTVAVVGQKNVSSVSRQAQGIFRITFASALATTNYGLMLGGRLTDFAGSDASALVQPNRDSTSGNNTYSTTTVDIAVQAENDNTTLRDPFCVGVVVFDPSAVSSSNYLAAASWTLSGTTLTLQRQLNVASMSRQAVGVYRANFTSAPPNADYSEFAMTRYPDATNVALALAGQNRNTTIPTNLHSTASLDLVTGRINKSPSCGNFEAGRGSVLISRSNVAPRGTIARVRFSMSGGVATIIESYNVSSITVQGTGLYRINFTTPASDNDYAVMGSGKWANATDDDTPLIGANRNPTGPRNLYSTTGVDIQAVAYTNINFDPDVVNVWVVKPWLM